MKKFFITATGTDIGKTWLTAALLRQFLNLDVSVDALKPIMSGFDSESCLSSDAAVLLSALGQAYSIENVARISPWRFSAPLSPDMAAVLEGRSIDFPALVEFCRNCQRKSETDILLIEGVGGCMVPLNDQRTVRDWIAALNIPAVLVTGSYLGSLSHVLTALAALRECKVPVTAIVINESEHSPVSLAQTYDTLLRHCDTIPVIAVARSEPLAGIETLAALMLNG